MSESVQGTEVVEIAWVTERMCVGTAIMTSSDVYQLHLAGVTYVINCQAERDDAPLLSETDIGYFWHGTPDWDLMGGKERIPIPAEWYKTGAKKALSLLTDPSIHLLIHCKNAYYRSIILTYATLRGFGIQPYWAKAMIIKERYQAAVALEVASAEADAAIAGGW